MSPKQKEICRTLQIMLWLWFGIITSFVATNVVNIARIQTENKITNNRIENLETTVFLLKYHSQQNLSTKPTN